MVHKSDYIESGGIPIVNPMNIIDGCIVKEKLAMVSPQKAHELARYTLQKNDILIARRGDLSKCAIVNEQSSGWLCGTGSFFLHIPFVEPQYIMLFYLSEYVQTILKRECVGATMENLNQGVLGNIPLLLPPIEEQKRIIQKVRTLETSVFNIDSGRQEVRQLISQVKSKILELAISGKLVPQDRADEPAADLLKRVNPNAVVSTDTSHYIIPSSWVWVKLEDIFEINPKNHNNDDDECGFVPMANVQDGYSGKHTFEVRKWREVKKGYCHFQNGDIAVAKISPCFENLKSVIMRSLPNNIGAGTTELVILRSKEVFAPYFLYLFKSPWYISKGTVYFKGVVGQQRVSRDIFTKLAVPMPPFNEQKRIVAKIDELFAVIDQIQQSLE